MANLTRASSRASRMGRNLCVAGATLGALGLLGWISGMGLLTTIVPGLPAMKPNTALGLLLIGSAGALRHPAVAAGRWRNALSVSAALVVLAIGAATLAEYVLELDLNIDRLLGGDQTGPHPGRPSPLTALALMLLANAVLTFDVRARASARPAEWLILTAALTALASLTGHAFGAGRHQASYAPIIGVSLPTAISLLLTSVGLLLERPATGIARIVTSPGPGGVLLRRLAIPAILAPLLLGFLITRSAPALGIEQRSLLGAILTSVLSVVSLVLLTVTAVALNRTHEALEASRAWVRTLVEQAPDGVFVAGLDGRYTDVNHVGCLLLGYAREEIVGKSIVDLLPPEEAGSLWESKERMLNGTADVGEFRLRRKDGRYVPVEVSASILPDGRWLGFVRDISERTRAQDQQRRLDEELRRAIRSRDDLLRVVAHDLRNPLNSIVMQASLLQRRGPEVERRSPRASEAIRRAAMRMNRLIQDLLDVTMAEAGRLSITRASLPAGQVVSDAVESQRALASSADLELRLDLAPDLPDALADRDRLLQVFENLIGNALKFTEPGGCITVGAAPREAEVLFWVADTGPGVPAEDAPHLFDHFWRGRDARSHGAGLGLPIVKGIVEAHGGRVWFESAPVQGSVFFFTIPAAPWTGASRPEPAPRGP